jgi:hypothetical protein
MALGLTQQALADQLKRKRLAIARYEGGTRTIPGVVEVALQSIGQSSRNSTRRDCGRRRSHRTHPPNRTY